jgi:hypothetical protein
MSYYGDLRTSDIIDFKFTTVNTSGVPTQLAGSPVLSAYKSNSVAQTTTGVTLTVDFDSVTGLNHVRVDTSADGTFYSTATNFDIIITTGTVGGGSVVGYTVGSFSIENRSGLRPTVAGRTLDVSAGGEAGVDWANVGTPGSTVSLSATTIATVTTATTATTVSALAANSVTASALATDAVNEIADGLLARAITESYSTDGAAPTVQQVYSQILAILQEPNYSGVTMTAKKLDGSTTAMTFTLNDAVNPTSMTRAT